MSVMHTPEAPLAERMRPKSLEDYVGQTHLIGADATLRRALEAGQLPSMILWGPPGVGKTTIIQCVAQLAEAGGAKVLLASPTFRLPGTDPWASLVYARSCSATWGSCTPPASSRSECSK